jgi:hypothetical protein
MRRQTSFRGLGNTPSRPGVSASGLDVAPCRLRGTVPAAAEVLAMKVKSNIKAGGLGQKEWE